MPIYESPELRRSFYDRTIGIRPSNVLGAFKTWRFAAGQSLHRDSMPGFMKLDRAERFTGSERRVIKAGYKEEKRRQARLDALVAEITGPGATVGHLEGHPILLDSWGDVAVSDSGKWIGVEELKRVCSYDPSEVHAEQIAEGHQFHVLGPHETVRRFTNSRLNLFVAEADTMSRYDIDTRITERAKEIEEMNRAQDPDVTTLWRSLCPGMLIAVPNDMNGKKYGPGSHLATPPPGRVVPREPRRAFIGS